MREISIRPVQLIDADILDLQKIGRRTFTDTFRPFNSLSSIETYIDRKFNVEQLTAELKNSESEFYFAEIDKQVVGYLKVNIGKAQTEAMPSDYMEVERIYVLSEFHGKKVGQKLFELALQLAYKKSVKSIWLGVWKKNRRAVRFYEKNGFVEFDEHIFMMGDDKQTDIMMKLDMNRF